MRGLCAEAQSYREERVRVGECVGGCVYVGGSVSLASFCLLVERSPVSKHKYTDGVNEVISFDTYTHV